MSQFPSEEDFEQNKEVQESIMKWRELPMNIIHKINSVELKDTKYGEATILTLENEVGDIFKCWSNQRLAEELKDFGWKDETCYLKSLGLVPSIKNPSHKYYKYDFARYQRK